MVLAWIAALVTVVIFAPQIAGDFREDYLTPGSESKAAADLLAERFPGSSGDTIDVVWQAPAGVDDSAVEAEMRRLLERASGLEGVGAADAPQISPDGTIAVSRLQLDRPSWNVPTETSGELVMLAEAAGESGVRRGRRRSPGRGGREPRAHGLPRRDARPVGRLRVARRRGSWTTRSSSSRGSARST